MCVAFAVPSASNLRSKRRAAVDILQTCARTVAIRNQGSQAVPDLDSKMLIFHWFEWLFVDPDGVADSETLIFYVFSILLLRISAELKATTGGA